MNADSRAHLEAVLVGGIEPVAIRLVPYDPAWPAAYDALAQHVRAVLGDRVLALDHIGSTAVPGLWAKPVVDAQLTVADVADEGAYVPGLALDVRVREPGHVMLRSAARDVHLHVHAPGEPALTERLLLRDLLRRDEAAREQYATVKRELATRTWEAMDDYAEAKTDVIRALLRQV